MQVSDTVSNSIRVVKTSKQAATEAVTYPAVIRDIIAKDGVLGLFGRGLKTKILANGLQVDSTLPYPNAACAPLVQLLAAVQVGSPARRHALQRARRDEHVRVWV